MAMRNDSKLEKNIKKQGKGAFLFYWALFFFSLSGSLAQALSFSSVTGLIRIPTASVEQSYGYQSMGGDKWLTISHITFMNRLEIGVRKHLSLGHTSGGYKLGLIQPSSYFPGFAVGAYDVGLSDKKPTYFLASTLIIESTGTTMHGGILSEGQWTALFDKAKSLDFRQIVDMADRTNTWYFGVEQSIFPMLSLLGEHINGVVNAGIRLRPVYQLTIDALIFDVNKLRDLPERRAYNLNLSFSF